MIKSILKMRKSRKIMTMTAIIATFLVSAILATTINHQGNTGHQVAEAAGRVNRQVDDTQEAFTEIKELTPEEQRLEASGRSLRE